MCKDNDRLNVFSYTLRKLVETHKEKYGLSSIQDALKSFSNTRIMKLLYFLCLESMSIDVAGNVKDNGLFGLFGKFYAFPNGPVIRDIYYNLDKVPGFKYEDGHFCECKDLVLISDGYKSMVDLYVDKLFNTLGSDLFNNREKLVNLTHKLPLWRDAFLYNPNKELSIEPKDLQDEYNCYIEQLKKSA